MYIYDYCCTYDSEKKLWTSDTQHDIFNENVSVGELAFFMMSNKNHEETMQVSDSEGTEMTYGFALTAAIRIAQHFERLKLTAADVVSIIAPNTTYVMPVALAAWFNCTPFQPLNAVMETNVVRQIFEKTKPKIIFCDGLNYQMIKKASETLKTSIYTICNHLENIARIEDLLEPTDSEQYFRPKALTTGPTQTMVIMASSGTTGINKLICMSNSSCISYAKFSSNKNGTIFATCSIDWLSGLSTLLINVLIGGLRVITHKPYEAEYLLEIITK